MFALLSPFLLVVAVMFVPALDMLLAIVRRTRAGRSPFSPDKMHLHHRLLQIGHSHRRVVLLIYLWVGIVALGAASTIFFDPRYTGAVMLAAILVAIVVTLIPLLRRGETASSTRCTTKSSRPPFMAAYHVLGCSQNPKKPRGLPAPGPSVQDTDRHGTTTDKGSCPLGDSSAPDALRYAQGATHAESSGQPLVTAGLR